MLSLHLFTTSLLDLAGGDAAALRAGRAWGLTLPASRWGGFPQRGRRCTDGEAREL